MKDEIGNSLGLPPMKPDVDSTTVVTRLDKSNTTDYDYARGNLVNIIEKGSEALDGIMDVASMSQHPRSYEVVSTLIKTLSDANKDLLDLAKKKKELEGDASPQTVNQNLYVGSSSELLKMLKQNASE
ncbi:MAG: terminase [Proteobacteria bacterium]|nr:terminase [Pseudomonadota bacterium]